MAVCGDPEIRHGIVLAKNEPAKKYGINTAETIWQAKRKCPHLVLTKPHFEEYRKFSRKINQIYLRYTDQVEPFSIDESWLDVTGSRRLFGSGREIADRLRAVIREETGLTVSAGVSFNEIYAKLGSDYKKPDATTAISRENYRSIVFPLPADVLMFCGKKAAQILGKLGIHTIGDLAAANRSFLSERLGKTGALLHDYAAGLDSSPVRGFREIREVKSVGNSITFRRDLTGYQELSKGIRALAENVAARMRKKGVKCWVVQLTVKDPGLKTISRQKTLPAPTFLYKELNDAAMELIFSFWNLKAPVRMLSLAGTSLVPADAPGEQLCFFEPGRTDARHKEQKLETTLDSIRERFGPDSVMLGGLMKDEIGFKILHQK